MKARPYLVILLLACLSGCGSQGPGVGAVIIHSESEFADASKTALELTEAALGKYDNGQQLEESDTKKLVEAIPYVMGLAGYRSNNPAPWVWRGQIAGALGDDAGAIDYFRTAVAIAPEKPGNDLVILLAEAHSKTADAIIRLSTLPEVVKKAKESKIDPIKDAKNEVLTAVELRPKEPKYLCQLASMLIEESKFDEAQEKLAEALLIEPENPRAKALNKFLQEKRGS